MKPRSFRVVPLVLGLALGATQACAPQAPTGAPSAPSAPAAADPGTAAPMHLGRTAKTRADRDGDGLADEHETRLGTDPGAAQVDTDRDGLPDELEARLGTNPRSIDSDKDGFTDLYEHANAHPAHHDRFPVGKNVVAGGGANVIAPGGANYGLLQAGAHTDSDGDGTHNALDNDGNGNGIPDGEEDQDGDGVANALELNGYHWDAVSQTFKPGDFPDGRAAYKTNPFLASSDLDPFSDGVEAKGQPIAGVSEVHPCRALYPQLEMQVSQIQWTPNGEITFTNGQSISSEQTQETSTEESTSTETSESLSSTTTVEVSATVGTEGVSGTATASEAVEYGTSTTNSHSSSTSVSNSSTTGTSTDWSTATTTDLNNAASLKLRVKFVNKGTTQLLNVVPTLDVKIGDRPVFTLRPQVAIETLGTTKENNFFEMTITADEQGQPLTLNLEELQLLQSGAPLSATVTQFSGSIQAPDPSSPYLTYMSLGSWSSYANSINEHTAELLLDTGEGSVGLSRVYAPVPNPDTSSPVVTVRDAVMWAYGGKLKDGKLLLTPDRSAPTKTASILNWFFFLTTDLAEDAKDPIYNNNVLAVPMQGGRDAVLIKAAAGSDDNRYPSVLLSQVDPEGRKLQLVANDYIGVKSVALRGARDFFTKDFKPQAPSPFAKPGTTLHYFNSALFGAARFGMDVDNYLKGHDAVRVTGVLTAHDRGRVEQEVRPLALKPFVNAQYHNFSTIGWGIDLAPEGRALTRRDLYYVGEKVEMPKLRVSPGDRWADVERRVPTRADVPLTLDPQEKLELENAWAKLAAMRAQRLFVSQDEYVVVVTNTRGAVSVFDSFGNLLRNETPPQK